MKIYISEHPRQGRKYIVLQKTSDDREPAISDGKVWTDYAKNNMVIESGEPLYSYIESLCPEDPSKYAVLEL